MSRWDDEFDENLDKDDFEAWLKICYNKLDKQNALY